MTNIVDENQLEIHGHDWYLFLLQRYCDKKLMFNRIAVLHFISHVLHGHHLKKKLFLVLGWVLYLIIPHLQDF